MKTILVTGADGFIGRNLREALARVPDTRVITIDVADGKDALYHALETADVVYHLAGVNRPEHEQDFTTGNTDLTADLVARLIPQTRKPIVVLSSSTQAALDNPYGRSKRQAEEAVENYGNARGTAVIFRLPNVFGKWSRPNYNSAVATFCYNIARGLDIQISDPQRVLELVYIDDVVKAFVELLNGNVALGAVRHTVEPVKRIALGEIVAELYRMRDVRTTLVLPDMDDRFRRCLFATYLSFLPTDGFAYQLTRHVDQRGALAEILKSPHFGQLFLSRTRPGVTRGNHFHHTKFEKFCVIEGDAVIRFRGVTGEHIMSYAVRGDEFRVVDIPPGYTHSIENVGTGEMIVLFWSSEMFDPLTPDTHQLQV
jgi:UDP-2-acetamido-2,6-beta-L-arabino-hexul-4-ose reductase